MFSLRHEWEGGRVVNGAELATCEHCATLRVLEPVQGPRRPGEVLAPVVAFIRRALEPLRVLEGVEPPCTSPAVRFQAPW